jgi:hypothetical protein
MIKTTAAIIYTSRLVLGLLIKQRQICKHKTCESRQTNMHIKQIKLKHNIVKLKEAKRTIQSKVATRSKMCDECAKCDKQNKYTCI